MTALAERIVKYMVAKNYKVFAGAGQYNLVYVEGMNADGSPNPDPPNCFNDRRLVIQILNNQPSIIGNWEATTEPGNYYTQHPMNVLGAARIAFGQYTAWAIGMHGQRDRHEALVQVAPVRVHRDFNKDGVRSGDRITEGLYGINQHWGYDLPFTNIANASAGCLVGRTRSGHKEFMKLLKNDVRYKGDHRYVFTTTIVAGDDLARRFPSAIA